MKTTLTKMMKIAAAMAAAGTTFLAHADAVTDTNEVTAVVVGWERAQEALGEQLTAAPESVLERHGLGGTGTYYVVSLEGGGFVVTSGDTSLEPVLAYSKTGEWIDDVKQNPLMAMLQIDIAAAAGLVEHSSAIKSTRLAAASTGSSDLMAELSSANAAKWARYKAAASQKSNGRLKANAPSSDLRVSPLVKSAWNQSTQKIYYKKSNRTTSKTVNLYNYYTPNNDVCGCVATMLSQIFRYWEWPKNTNITARANYFGWLRYGDDDAQTITEWDLNTGYYTSAAQTAKQTWSPAFGGTYDWSNMPTNFTSSYALNSESAVTAAQEAIGKLTRDCGIVCAMDYSSGGSGATMLGAQRAVHQFAYANGKTEVGLSDASRAALLASLDAGMPCGVSVSGDGGHAIVADGYGYSSGTLYVHFNMGWGDIGSDRWYTPPNVSSFTSVSEILYNIYPPSKGAPDLTVVSGRVLRNSTAQSGVTVTATDRETGFSTNVTSNAKGIYYFMLPRGYYSFTATSGSYSAKAEREVKLCTSDHVRPSGAGGYVVTTTAGESGNIHGLDLNLGTAISAPAVSLTHRWSFAGDLTDSVGSSTATKIGSNVELVDGKAVCTGSGAGQGSLNLGSNLLNTDGATIEIWAANDAVVSGSRVFEYGTSSSYYFMMAWTKNTDLYIDCAEAFSGGNNNVYDENLAPYALGKQYHISATFERQSDGTTTVRAMRRDAASGALLKSAVFTVTNGIHTFSSPLLRLGRSFQGNADAKATYDEVRVWQGVLTDAQLKASALAGPDANLSTLPWNASAVRYVAKATWTGSRPSSAADLENSSNWSCLDQNGDAISGVPEARSIVIIPNGSTSFTIPSGYVPAWRKVRIGTEGAAATKRAKRSAASSYAGQYEAGLLSYADSADVPPDALARDIMLDVSNAPSELAAGQLRYDGWLYVTAAQAGRWTFTAYADDYGGIAIDGEWLATRYSMSGGIRITCADVSAGWHRFTVIAGDTGGGYGGCILAGDQSTMSIIAVSVNDGHIRPFDSANFTFGAAGGTSSVTLSGDCDLSAVDEVLLDTGSAIDLNGHALKVNAISSSYLGASVANSSATEATLEYVVPLAESGAATDIAIASNIAKRRLITPETPDKFVKYLESNGSQWFDTEVVGRPGTKAEVTVACLNTSDTCILGARNGDERFNLLWSNGGYGYLGYRDTWNLLSRSAGLGDKHVFTCEIAADGSCSMSMDGDEASTDASKTLGSSDYYSLYLFSCDNGGAASWASSARLYRCRIWQDGELVRDFTPCVKDGVAALYDAVSGGVFRPGSGTFETGPRTPDRTYTWVGGASGNLSAAANWSPTPAGAFTEGDELLVTSAANITVDSAATVARVRFNSPGSVRLSAPSSGTPPTLTVGEVVNEGTGAATFDCPVQFIDKYSVEKTASVKFSGGATATYPYPEQRSVSSSDITRTFEGVITFTADWDVPNIGDGSHQWRIPEGTEVYGQKLTGSESGTSQFLYIANGGYARFTTVAVGNNCGNIGIDGTLEATTEVTIGIKGGSGNLGSGGTAGVVKAPCIRKVGGYIAYCNVPNIYVGAGGIGCGYKDYDFRFNCNTVITAMDDFDFIGVWNSSNPADWGLHLNGKTVTVNVPEGITVRCGVGIQNSGGVIRKTGAGTLVMTGTDKNGQSGYLKKYTGGTVVEEGTVRVEADDQLGTGDVTIYPAGRLEIASGVTVAPVVKTSATGAGVLYMENGSSVALSAATPCSLANFELASGASATLTTSSSADAGAVLLSGAAGDYSSRLTIPSGFSYSGGCVMVPGAAAAATDYVWAGASGASWSAASSWRVNGATPASAPGSGDTIRFENSSAIAVGGSGTLTVTKIVTTTGAEVTFNVPVAFASTYLVENAVIPPVFAQGATATCPDTSLTDMNAASHVLPDGLSLTADWDIPQQPTGNPFVVPAGASISGQKLTTTADYSAGRVQLRIDEGAVATFATVSQNRRLMLKLNGGRLVVTGDYLIDGTGGGADIGDYNGNIGTIVAHGFYKSASSGGSMTQYFTNLVIGAGGFGMLRRDYMWTINRDCTLTASDDFTIHEPHTTAGALDGQKDGDWGLQPNGYTFTIDTAGHTVTFDSYVREGSSKIVKKGAGEMIMRSRQKKHTGGTDVKEGKLTVALSNGAGYGTTTVRSGATLAFTSAATAAAYPVVVKSGATLEWAAAVSGTSTLEIEGGATLKPPMGGAFTAATLSLSGGSGPILVDLTSAAPGMTIPILGGATAGVESQFEAILPAGLEGEFVVNGSGVLCFNTPGARLAHRWSFNEDYGDSAGSANATVAGGGNVSLSGGKAVLAGGDNAGYLNLGAGVLGTGNAATLELWATNIAVASDVAYLFTYGLHDATPNSFVTLCNRSSGLSYSRTTRNGMIQAYVAGTTMLDKNEILIGMPEGMSYHYSITFTASGADTVTRWMVRSAQTGCLLAEYSVTLTGLTLAEAASAGWALTLGHNPFTGSSLDLNCAFDEVRVWDGVLGDEQLTANAIAGPDAPLGSGSDRVVVNPGETFTVGTAGGYGYKTDSTVTLGAGAKIRFDTTGYFGKALRFKSGGFTVASGSVLDYVELSDSTNYAATMEDANTILVQLKSTVPYESTWSGSAPSSAADLSNAANWTSVNAQGSTISAAPTAKTTVILPASALASFTVPDGTAIDWGRVVLGGRTATQAGKISGSPDMNKLAYLYRGVADYTSLGATEVSNLNGNGKSVTFLKNNLAESQVRFDGWVNVSAANAGKWYINSQFDDAVTLFIDGERVFHDPCWQPAVIGGCFVSEGWHRFTLIAADGGGGYGCHANDTIDGTKVPFRITVNGSTVAFHTFTFGSDSDTVTLSADADWSALGPVIIESGLTIDLNGHTLSVAAIDSESLGAVIKNTSGTASTLNTYSGTVGSGVKTENITVGRYPVATATWTGAAEDSDIENPDNWICYSSGGVLMAGALPTPETTATVSDAPAAVATSGDAPDYKWLDIGTVANKTGTVTVGDGATLNVSFTSNRSVQMGTVDNATANFNVNGGTVTIGSLNAPSGGNSAKVTVNVTGGSLTMSGWTDFGRNSANNAIFNQSGGTVTAGGNLWIGRSNNGLGTYNLSNGTLNQNGGTLDLGESSGCKGIFNMTGGNLNSTVNYSLGRNGVGEMTISGGTTSLRTVYVGHQNTARGTITQTGGTFTFGNSNTSMSIGEQQNAAGLYLQTRGTLNTADANANLYVGNSGRGVLDAAGTVTVTKAGYGVVLGNGATGRGELRLRDGGSLTTSYIKKGNASAVAGAAFGAATLTTKQANTTFINGMNGLVFDPGAFTLNADHNVTISGNTETFASAGARFAKTGAGTLTIDTLPPVDDFAVNAGTVALSANNASARAAVNAAAGNEYPSAPSATLLANNYLLHRWNFNGHALDLVGTNHAFLVGSGSVTYNSGADVQLPGGGNGTGYVSLGANTVPNDDTPFTIELWVTRKGQKTWQRVVELGSTATSGNGMKDGIILSFNQGSSESSKPSFKLYQAAGAKQQDTTTIPVFTTDEEYHIALVFWPVSAGNWSAAFYIYDSSGTLHAANTITDITNWKPSQVTMDHVWLGHSHWSADNDALASFNEVRIWNCALSQAQVEANGTLGPDTLPVLSATSTLGVTENITVASGATFDLGGHSLTEPSLTGSGTVQNGTLSVGTLTPGGDGTAGTIALNVASVGGTIRIDSGDAFTTTTAGLDLSGATIDLTFTPAANYTFATASGSGSFAGKPSFTVNGEPLKGWKVRRSADGKTLSIVKIRGTMILAN